jgi:hypothetical protein
VLRNCQILSAQDVRFIIISFRQRSDRTTLFSLADFIAVVLRSGSGPPAIRTARCRELIRRLGIQKSGTVPRPHVLLQTRSARTISVQGQIHFYRCRERNNRAGPNFVAAPPWPLSGRLKRSLEKVDSCDRRPTLAKVMATAVRRSQRERQFPRRPGGRDSAEPYPRQRDGQCAPRFLFLERS